ncbi:MAG: stage III sporulation protein AE [Oscillospiraceae bacterium]|nr:stage III sporulation protein AE [Oscillospiraceae bacterium]
MKKFLIFLTLIIKLFPTFSSSAELAESPVPDFGQAEIFEGLENALPDDAREFMGEVKPLELTFSAVVAEIWTLLKQEILKPLKMFVSLVGVILLCAAAETLRDSGGKSGNSATAAFEIAGVLAGAGIMSAGIADSVVRTSQTLTAAGAFMLIFIPILAGIMAVMGQVASAGLLNTAVVAAAQIFSQVMVMALMPLSVSVLGVSIAGAVSPVLKTERVANAVKTVVIWTLGFLSTVFVGLLTIQSLITGNTDSVAMKAVKFTVSGSVPIIGGAVGDALGVLNGSVSVVKNSTGAFGMFAIAATCLPALLSAVGFRLALTLSAAVSDMFGAGKLGSLLKSGESIMSIILAMIVCFMVIMLVSVAIMIKIGSGA